MSWNWRPVGVPTSLGVAPPALEFPMGTARIAVSSGELVHLLAEGRELVQHFTIDRDAAVVRLPDLPLKTLSSAVAAASRVAVAGAAAGDHRPVVCLLDDAGDATPIDVPSAFDSGEAAPVASWPKLAVADGLWVVWAVGRERAQLRCATISGGELRGVGSPLPAKYVLDLQIAGAAGRVDVLWQDAAGIHLRHDPADTAKPSVVPGFSSRSRLIDGHLVTPRAGYRIDVQEIESGAVHQLRPARPLDGAGEQIVSAETIADLRGRGHHLTWTTQAGAEDLGDPPGLSARSRTWIATVDAEWRLSSSDEVPAPSQCFAALDDRLFAFPVTGPVPGWLAIPS